MLMPQPHVPIDPADVEINRELVSGLPVVNAVLARLGLDRLLGA